MNKITVKARDNIQLACFQFICERPKARIFCLHGATYSSRRYFNLARTCQAKGLEVILIDWRGHGDSEGRAGHCSYPGQLEDDLQDVISALSEQKEIPIIVGGHSAGAVISLRFLKKYGQQNIAGCFLIAPALANFSELARNNYSSKVGQLAKYWRLQASKSSRPTRSSKYSPKVNNFLFWNARFLKFMRKLNVLEFPDSGATQKVESRILNYSYNLMMSSSINNYVESFSNIKIPLILICGESDEVVSPQSLDVVFNWHLSPLIDKSLYVIPKANHLSIINASSKLLQSWISERWGEVCERCA